MEAYLPFLFRPVTHNDLEPLHAFAKVADLTNLPSDRTLLAAHIAHAVKSFESPIEAPRAEDFYLFVMEDTRTGQLAGCSAIYADVGTHSPFYSFKWDKKNETLLLNTDIHHVSEMAALYLSPDYRMHHMGGFLSRARYLWIIAHPQRFHDDIIAEMHGRVDKNQQSPFWEGVVHPYIQDKNFAQADKEVFLHHTDFIQSRIPRILISTRDMNKRTRASMGLPNKVTRAAVPLLLKEGFVQTDYLSLFDGGPILRAHKNELRTIRNSHILQFAGTTSHPSETFYLIGTTAMPFHGILTAANIDLEQGCCYLTPEAAHMLSVEKNDTLCLSLF
jgi:arginine N-succinyltransferase